MEHEYSLVLTKSHHEPFKSSRLLFKNNFNIILSSTHKSLEILSLSVPTKSPYTFISFTCVLHVPFISFLFICFPVTVAHPAAYPMGIGGCFPGGKAAGAWSWPLTSTYCRGKRIREVIPPLPQYVFKEWCAFKHRDNFTFTFTFNNILRRARITKLNFLKSNCCFLYSQTPSIYNSFFRVIH